MMNFKEYMQQSETLAEFVSRILHEKGISGYDIERKTGKAISQSYANRIKNGEVTNPTIDKLQALAKGIGVSEDRLFDVARGVKREPQGFAGKAQSLLAEAEHWTTAQQQTVLMLLRYITAGIRLEDKQDSDGYQIIQTYVTGTIRADDSEKPKNKRAA